MSRIPALLLLAAAANCAKSAAVGPHTAPSPQPSSSAAVVVPAHPATSAHTLPKGEAGDLEACGNLRCRTFEDAESAFDFVLRSRPRVLAIGEAHAQSDSQTASTTRRFMDTLLPRLAPRASDLVIELWVQSGSCGKPVEQQVARQQRAVTAPQAESNQGEFVELGHRAKALRIQPHALVPTCEQHEKIANAGPNDVEEMLRMLARVTARDLEVLHARREPERLLVAYGGALHNDLHPRPGREAFSFGPELSRLTGGRYVELDLIRGEQIKDNEIWRAQPWYERHVQQGSKKPVLYSWAVSAYALVWPSSR